MNAAISPFEPMSEEVFLSLGSMEGLADLPSVVKRKPRTDLYPGYAISIALALVAYAIHYLPFPPFLVGTRRPISASILAIVIAVLIRNLQFSPLSALAGSKHIVRNLIPVSIVLAGAGLNLTQVATVGWKALLIVVASMALAAGSAIWFGRLLGLLPRTAALIGAGTAICGTSAIVATAPLIEAEDEDLTLSLGTVSFLGLVLMFALPFAGGLLNMTQEAFGVWAGTTIHAVPQVVAAGFTYGTEAGTLATLVKLARVAMLAPFLLIVSLFYRQNTAVRPQASQLVPTFVWGFLAFALLNTLGLIPSLLFPASNATFKLGPWLVEAGNWLLTVAMAAIGLEVNLRLLLKVGSRALLTGFAAMVLLCAASFALIQALL